METQQCVPSVLLTLCSCQQYKSDQRRHVNATMGSLCIDVNLYVAVNNTRAISVAMETQQCVPSVLMLTCM